MDYRKILKAYLVHVAWSEGVTFLPYGAPCKTPIDTELTEAERQELFSLDKELSAASRVSRHSISAERAEEAWVRSEPSQEF